MGVVMDLEIRSLANQSEREQCVELQRETWGEDFRECVPPSIQHIVQKMGGIAAGAFAPDGRMAGCVFGITGVRNGRPAHWSHMLAVRRSLRDQGVGRKLKLYQRQALLQQGINIMYWTYDPLVARNAHLNLNRLGAVVDEYVEDMYAGMDGSFLHQGLGTDRFVVSWDLRAEPEGRAPAPRKENLGPIVNTRPGQDGSPQPFEGELPDAESLRVEIPPDIQQAKRASPESGKQWRSCTRHAFEHYLGQGWRVEGFLRDPQSGRCFYLLGKRDGGGEKPQRARSRTQRAARRSSYASDIVLADNRQLTADP